MTKLINFAHWNNDDDLVTDARFYANMANRSDEPIAVELLAALQAAVAEYVSTHDAELNEEGYFKHGEMLGTEACNEAMAAVRAAIDAIRNQID